MKRKISAYVIFKEGRSLTKMEATSLLNGIHAAEKNHREPLWMGLPILKQVIEIDEEDPDHRGVGPTLICQRI